ncbi:MAG: hypothetical protein Q8R28_22265, partial [Dehalococcoidia bacterium]|nr:hypothetical protein [Dehalococcoidia bacterium]
MRMLNGFLFGTAFFALSACFGGGDYIPLGEVLEVKRGDRLLVPMTFIDPHSPPRSFELLGIRCADPDAGELVEAYHGVLARETAADWCLNRQITLERPLVLANGLMDRSQGWAREPRSGEYLHELLLRQGLARADLQGRDLGDKGRRIVALEDEARAAG